MIRRPGAGANPPRTRNRWLPFCALGATHLAAHLFCPPLANATKPLLMPALALAVAPAAPPLLLGALAASCAGDTLLLAGSDGPAFLAGMGAFAVAHGCYITLFRRTGTRRAPAAWAYVPLWGGTVAALWPGLAPDMRGPVAAYSLLLVGTAATALRHSPRAGLGGALFLLSDTLIATDVAGWPQLPAKEVWVMATYLAAQYLLATAAIGDEAAAQRREELRGRPEFEPHL